MVQLATAYRDPDNGTATAQVSQHDPADLFQRSFSAEVANSDELRREVYRLRYQVYCAERGFENPDQFAAGLEADRYDEHASHALVRHRQSGLVVGVVRLVSRGGVGESSFLPIEEASAHVFDPALLEQFDHTSQQVAEVSRFAVSKEAVAQALRVEGGAMSADARNQSGTPSKLIAWGLIALLFKMSHDMGVEHWMALMERSLARHLSRLGIDFRGIGPVIDYHGKRQPMIASVEDLLLDIQSRRSDFFELVRAIMSENKTLTVMDGQRNSISSRNQTGHDLDFAQGRTHRRLSFRRA